MRGEVVRGKTGSRAAALLVLGLAACALDPFPGPAAPPPCKADAECDDADPCTTDTCSAGWCAHGLAAAGTACGAGPGCAGARTCDGHGQCQAGAPMAVDDGDPCTADACDAATGQVTHTPVARCWTALPAAGAPTARQDHTAVWTGSKMLVWGGDVGGKPSVTSTGAAYDPVSRQWTPLSATGAPAPRSSHVAVWTGSRMLVWGGYGVSAYETGGGVYDPGTDTWTPMSTTGAPSGRTGCSATWTGARLLVWGGIFGGTPLGDGAEYDPSTDTWTPVPTAGALSARFHHTAVLTTDRVLFWGGYDTVNWFADGGPYDPVTRTWLAATPQSGAPEYREQHTAVWTGSRMVIWGGADPSQFIGTGASLDPVAATWVPLSATSAPSPRGGAIALWTGSAMLVWGGCGGQVCDALDDGGLWAPDAGGGTWTSIPASSTVAGRHAHTAVWTGTRALVWGGATTGGRTDTGGSFAP